jgi:hypothetical protein
LVISTYLLIAALSLLRAQFRAADGVEAGPLTVCVVALVFAAAWPLRAARRALHLIGWSS